MIYIYIYIYFYIMESELVSGFMTEHAASIFVFFFLAEYASILLMSILTTILFLGGYACPITPFIVLDSLIELIIPLIWGIGFSIYRFWEIIYISSLSLFNIEAERYLFDCPLIPFKLVDVLDNLMENPISAGFIAGLILGVKTCLIVFTFVWVRASFPRIRYDQLMTFCWTVLLPILFAFIILIPCVLYSFDAIPVNFSLLVLTPSFFLDKILDDDLEDSISPLQSISVSESPNTLEYSLAYSSLFLTLLALIFIILTMVLLSSNLESTSSNLESTSSLVEKSKQALSLMNKTPSREKKEDDGKQHDLRFIRHTSEGKRQDYIYDTLDPNFTIGPSLFSTNHAGSSGHYLPDREGWKCYRRVLNTPYVNGGKWITYNLKNADSLYITSNNMPVVKEYHNAKSGKMFIYGDN